MDSTSNLFGNNDSNGDDGTHEEDYSLPAADDSMDDVDTLRVVEAIDDRSFLNKLKLIFGKTVETGRRG